MFRFAALVLAMTFVSAWIPATGQAQGRHSRNHLHRGHSRFYSYGDRYGAGRRWSTPSTFFGFSFGTLPYGYDYAGYPDPYFLYPYSYDPWLRGSFRAPDLLDDPYFYDRVPRTRSYHSPPVLRTQPRQSLTPSYSQSAPPSTIARHQEVVTSERTAEVIEDLQSASETLLQRLGRYGGGEAWIEHLAPDRIIALILDGNLTELQVLLQRYDEVVRSPELQIVSTIDGFAETRQLLRQYLLHPLDISSTSDEGGREEEAVIETLPAPRPDATLNSAIQDASEI